MLLHKLNLTPFFAPVDTSNGVGAIEDKALSRDEVIDMLGEDEPESETLELEKPAKKAAKDNNKEDKEEKEKTLEEEIEEELEEPDEDKLELTVPIRRRKFLQSILISSKSF